LKKNKFEDSGFEKYSKFSGLTIQMFVIIFIFVWGGVKLDEKYNSGGKAFTIVFSLLGVFIGLYIALKDFIKFKGKK
jgi:hypothetical protein